MDDAHDRLRRNLLVGGALAGAAATGASASPTPDGRSDTETRTLDGQAVPEFGADKSAGPIRPARGSGDSAKNI